METIRQHFEKSVKLTDPEWEYFAAKLNRIEVPKKTALLKQGRVENHLSFVEKGVVRFYIPGVDTDRTFGFVFAGNFLSAYDSFLTRTPSTYQLETLSATVLWSLTHSDLQDIYTNTAIGHHIGRLAAEDLFVKKAKRELSLLNHSPEKRYLNLFTEQPQLIRHIPLKYIASYIGITPQALSRIRKRIT